MCWEVLRSAEREIQPENRNVWNRMQTECPHSGFLMPKSQWCEKQVSVLAKIMHVEREENGLLPYDGGLSVKTRDSLGPPQSPSLPVQQ